MYDYTVSQWLLFFFVYCFLGWVWESCYVSVKDRKWTNRGFMKGPFLPIYGSGAIIILVATLPFKSNVVLVFFAGMFAATLLEYFTGVAMETLFKVRYWDYSGRFMNLNGHICLKCSIVWGVFSIFMVKVIHVPIEHLITKIPDVILQIVTLVMTVIIAGDFATSFRDAIDFKQLLMSVASNNDELEKIRKRLDVRIAFADADYNAMKQKLEQKRDELNLQRYYLRKKLESSSRLEKLIKRHPSAKSVKFAEAFEQIKNNIESRRNDRK